MGQPAHSTSYFLFKQSQYLFKLFFFSNAKSLLKLPKIKIKKIVFGVGIKKKKEHDSFFSCCIWTMIFNLIILYLTLFYYYYILNVNLHHLMSILYVLVIIFCVFSWLFFVSFGDQYFYINWCPILWLIGATLVISKFSPKVVVFYGLSSTNKTIYCFHFYIIIKTFVIKVLWNFI